MPSDAVPSEGWSAFALAITIALSIAALVCLAVWLGLRTARSKQGFSRHDTRKIAYPVYASALLLALHVAVTLSPPRAEWFDVDLLRHGLVILSVIAGAWLASATISAVSRVVRRRHPITVKDNRVARRIHTQVNALTRIAIAAIIVIAAGLILNTYPGARAIGVSILASAGVAGIVAALAAQSTLSSVFAGVQLAFSDAVRVDDVVIVEGEWGVIEEITMTYVVVKVWDERRLVLPCTYFTTTPFQNWTRRTSDLLGSVEFDLDWRVSPALMRVELDRILDSTHLWDRRAKVLQVTEAVGGFVRVRVLVTATDAPTLFDLRCLVREELIEWIRTHDPEALPRTRVQVVERDAEAGSSHATAHPLAS